MTNLALTGNQTPQAFRAVFAYQWFRDGTPLFGVIGPTYTIAAPDVSQQLQVLMTPTSGFTLPEVGMIGLSQENTLIGNSGLYQVGKRPFTGNLNYFYNSANETFQALYVVRVEDVGQTLIAFVPDSDFPSLTSFPMDIPGTVVTEPTFISSATLIPKLQYSLARAVGSFVEIGSTLTTSKVTLLLPLGLGSFIRTGHTVSLIKGLIANTGTFVRTTPAIVTKAIIHMSLGLGLFNRTGSTLIIFSGNGVVENTGVFARSGHLTTLQISHSLTASSGVFINTGLSNVILKGLRTIASLGSFARVGFPTKFNQQIPANNGGFAIGFGPFNLTDKQGNILVDKLGNPLRTTPYHLIFGFGIAETIGSFGRTTQPLRFGFGVRANTGSFFGAGNSETGVIFSPSFLAPASSPSSPLTDTQGNILTDSRGG